jgi:hypothetical protein
MECAWSVHQLLQFFQIAECSRHDKYRLTGMELTLFFIFAGVVVATPLEDYFLRLDGLPAEERRNAMACARPYLDAMGSAYAAPAEGTAFYAVQSCLNHSCQPNAHTLKVRTFGPT